MDKNTSTGADEQVLDDQGNVDVAEPETLVFTKEELDAHVQSEADRRVNQAHKKWEKDYEERITQERAEAEKLARMSAQERAEAQLKKDREEFEKVRQELAREKLELSTRKLLSEEKLSPDFAPFLMAEDADATEENISVFKKEFDEAVRIEVNNQLRSNTPPSHGGETKPSTPSLGAQLAKEYNERKKNVVDPWSDI